MFAKVTQHVYLPPGGVTNLVRNDTTKKFRVNLAAALGMLQGRPSLTEITRSENRKIDGSSTGVCLGKKANMMSLTSMETTDSLQGRPGSSNSQQMTRASDSGEEDSASWYSAPPSPQSGDLTRSEFLFPFSKTDDVLAESINEIQSMQASMPRESSSMSPVLLFQSAFSVAAIESYEE